MDDFRAELKAIAEEKAADENKEIGIDLIQQMQELKAINEKQLPTLYKMTFSVEREKRQRILQKISKLKKRLGIATQQDVLVWVFDNLVEM